MSRIVRIVAASLLFAALAGSTLGALPFGSRPALTDTGRSDFLTAVMEWIASRFGPDQPAGETPKPPDLAKEGPGVDPHGGPH